MPNKTKIIEISDLIFWTMISGFSFMRYTEFHNPFYLIVGIITLIILFLKII